jgi:modification methylase
LDNWLNRRGRARVDPDRCKAALEASGAWPTVRSNAADISGSIHQVGAALRAPSCNGWTFWHRDVAGKLEAIDALRQRHLSAP